jgi:acyl carrier protein
VTTVDHVREVLAESLGLGLRAQSLTAASALLGNVPELDSMAVVNVIVALEQRFGIRVHDDEIGADSFETLGSLAHFVEQKLRERLPAEPAAASS